MVDAARLRTVTPDAPTCSIGYVEWDRVEGAAALLRAADVALYQAKDDGGATLARA